MQDSTASGNFSIVDGLTVLPGELSRIRERTTQPEPTLPWDNSRTTSLDGVRLIACLAVIWVHSDFGPQLQHLGRMGTTCFAILAALFVLKSARLDQSKSYPSYLTQRFRQLMVPGLIWSTIAMIPVEWRTWREQGLAYWPSIEDVLCGRSRFLWFLTFAFVMSAVLWPLGKGLARLSRNGAGTAAKGFCVLGVWLTAVPDQNFEFLREHAYLPERAWECLPVVCWAISIDIWLRQSPALCGRRGLAWVGVALVVLTSASIFVVGFTILGKSVSGLGLFLVAAGSVRAGGWRWLAPIGRLSFGVYLTHAFVIGVLRQFDSLRVDGTFAQTWPYFLLVATLSLATAVLIRSNRWTAWTIR